jgi:hypothetical protein
MSIVLDILRMNGNVMNSFTFDFESNKIIYHTEKKEHIFKVDTLRDMENAHKMAKLYQVMNNSCYHKHEVFSSLGICNGNMIALLNLKYSHALKILKKNLGADYQRLFSKL